ncbi:MAG: YncE family protein [Anaerolineales bacterium]|nr:YncE family protein [Anaerolineales bacterium]
MNKSIHRLILSLLVLVLMASLTAFTAVETGSTARNPSQVVVANRGSGTISVIDANSDVLIGTYALPAGAQAPEPMYVVYTPAKNRIFVGDRANDRVVVFDARNFSVVGTVATGQGVFHMWADPQNQQLWVNNDIDNTTTVIDPKTLEILATVPTPADLVAQGGKPHDVILDPTGDYAYITVLGLAGPNDYVVKFSTETFAEVDRAPVGKDPHLSLARQNNLLYVPSQNSDVVVVLDRTTLDAVTDIPVPGAHGAGMAKNGKVFYTTNLPGGGASGLFAIDTQTNTVIGAVDTPYAVPHNIALTSNGKKVFITHSGATSDKVTIYTSSPTSGLPSLSGEVTVGLNPFGLAFIP